MIFANFEIWIVEGDQPKTDVETRAARQNRWQKLRYASVSGSDNMYPDCGKLSEQ